MSDNSVQAVVKELREIKNLLKKISEPPRVVTTTEKLEKEFYEQMCKLPEQRAARNEATCPHCGRKPDAWELWKHSQQPNVWLTATQTQELGGTFD